MDIHVSMIFYLIRQIQGENNIQMWCTCKYACDVSTGKDRKKSSQKTRKIKIKKIWLVY